MPHLACHWCDTEYAAGPFTVDLSDPSGFVDGVLFGSVVGDDLSDKTSWIAAGNPAELFSRDRHDELWAVQEPLHFPGTGLRCGPRNIDAESHAQVKPGVRPNAGLTPWQTPIVYFLVEGEVYIRRLCPRKASPWLLNASTERLIGALRKPGQVSPRCPRASRGWRFSPRSRVCRVRGEIPRQCRNCPETRVFPALLAWTGRPCHPTKVETPHGVRGFKSFRLRTKNPGQSGI